MCTTKRRRTPPLPEQELAAHQQGLDLPSFAERRLPALLYADDLALVSTSARGLHAYFDVLHGYATKWRLTFNIGKTKGIVFRRLKSKVYPLPLVYAGAQLEVVDSFRYLGLDLDCSKSIDTASGIRAEAAGRLVDIEQSLQRAGNPGTCPEAAPMGCDSEAVHAVWC